MQKPTPVSYTHLDVYKRQLKHRHRDKLQLDAYTRPLALHGTEGSYKIRFKDNRNGWDCAYPAAELLPDLSLIHILHGFPAGFVAAAVPELGKSGPQGLVPGSLPRRHGAPPPSGRKVRSRLR